MKYLITTLLLLGFTVGCDKPCIEYDEVISIGGCRASDGVCGVMTKNHGVTYKEFPVIGEKIRVACEYK